MTALAEKLSALLTEEYLEERTREGARRGSRKKFEQALSKVQDRDPDPGDEL